MKRIEIIAPASSIKIEDVKKTKSFLKTQDFLFGFPKFEKSLICSASYDKRLSDLKAAFKNKESDFIWCLRGGYGSHQLLDGMSRKDYKIDKVLMGFSDITSLHYYINQVLERASVHGPHANSFINVHSKKVLKETLGFIHKPKDSRPVFNGLKRLNKVGQKPISAKVIGGNLVSLQAVIGTDYDKGVKGRILFLEEIAEPAYKINRILEHMKQSGFLTGVRAVVLGGFTHENKKELLKINAYLKDWAKEQNFPVLSGMSAGHIKENRPFWLGKKSLLTLDRALDQKVSLHNNV